MTDRLRNADEIADMLGVPTSWVREHTRNGLLPHVELGRYRRYRVDDVLEWLETQNRGGAAWRRHKPTAL